MFEQIYLAVARVNAVVDDWIRRGGPVREKRHRKRIKSVRIVDPEELRRRLPTVHRPRHKGPPPTASRDGDSPGWHDLIRAYEEDR